MSATSSALLAGLPFAFGIVVSSVPILALVLLMVTTRPLPVSFAFLAGWFLGLVTVATLVILVGDVGAPRGLPDGVATGLRIALGVTLWAMAIRSWLRRKLEAGKTPGWMSGVGRWTPGKAWVTGYLLGSVNPKSLALAASAAVAILVATSTPSEQAVAVAVFAVVASVGVAIPILLRTLPAPAIQTKLETAGTWMTTHAKGLSRAVLAALGTFLLISALPG